MMIPGRTMELPRSQQSCVNWRDHFRKDCHTYMYQMGICAQWSKAWTITKKDSDFSTELQNILDEQFNLDRPNTVWCSDHLHLDNR